MGRRDAAKVLSVLAGASLFRGLASEARGDVLREARERTVGGGGMLFREGDPASALYLAIHGRLKLTQVGADGHEVILRFAGPGEAVAAVALFEEATYPLSAQAVGESRVLAWHPEVLRDLFRRHPQLALNTMQLLSERLREVQERFRELATERVAQRIARSLLRLVRQAGRRVEGGVLIDLPLSRQDLAQMTGTTLFTVSRVLSEWESQGILESGRERVLIRRPHGLVALAEDLPPSPPSAERL
jgi:CRP/FNR family transcriptional regulator, nitrogen oxide reductase regulator